MHHPCSFDSSALANQLGITMPSPEHQVNLKCRNERQVSLWVKRDDLLHPVISGNKWRKLQHPLQNIDTQSVKQVISFGGGHSNHLHALAFCCQQLKLPFIAMVRGDYSANLTPTLTDMLKWGAKVNYVNKQTYQQKDQPAFLDALANHYPHCLIIPEGGSQQHALDGVGNMVAELQNRYDVIIAPVASGATLAGLINAYPYHHSEVIGIAVLKGKDYLEQLVARFLPPTTAPLSEQKNQSVSPWHIEHDFHHGGYAKRPSILLDFCQQFTHQTQIPIEPVYSGKLFFAILHMIENNHFKPNQRILAVHTGGLQGARNSMDTHSNTNVDTHSHD